MVGTYMKRGVWKVRFFFVRKVCEFFLFFVKKNGKKFPFC